MNEEEERMEADDRYGSTPYSTGRNTREMRRMNYIPGDRGPEGDLISRNYRTLFMFSFVLIMVAVIIMAGSKYPNAPDEDNYDDYDNYREDYKDHVNIVNDVQNTADMIFTIGIVMICFLLFMAPFVKLEISPAMRIVLIVVGLIMLTHFLNDGFDLQVILG